MSRTHPRPLCPVCRVTPIKRPWEMQTCGARCGAIKRWSRYNPERRKAMTAIGRRAMDQQIAKARVQWFAQELHDLLLASTPLEKVRILNRIYRRGRHDEYRRLMDRLRKQAAA